MHDDGHARRRTVAVRETARDRVRRATGVLVAASLAVAGSLAGYVANAAPGRKASRRPAPVARTPHPKAKRVVTVPVPQTPAPPRLIRSAGEGDDTPSAPAPAPSQAPAPAPAQSPAPAPAPAPTPAPPVVVSGGS